MKRNRPQAPCLIAALAFPVLLLGTGATAVRAQAVSSFTGTFAPSHWSLGSNPPSPQLATFQGSLSATLTNYPAWAVSGASMQIVTPSAGLVSFDYAYNGPNPGGCPGSYSTAVGEAVTFTDPIRTVQSGQRSFFVSSASTIGFALNGLWLPSNFGCQSTSVSGPAATLTISGFRFVPAMLVRPFGDSITYGFGSGDQGGYCPLIPFELPQFDTWCPMPDATGGGYRAWLTTIAVETQQFMFRTEGSQNGGSNALQWVTSTQAHDGYPGYRTDQLAPYAALPSFADVTLVHAGTNDIYQCHAATQAASILFQDIDSLLASNSKTHLYVAKIIKMYPTTNFFHCVFSGHETWNSAVAAYNRRIQELWNGLQPGKRSRITLVDMESLLSQSADYSDGIHPNGAGYKKMACTWLRAVRGLPLDPQVPCSGIFR